MLRDHGFLRAIWTHEYEIAPGVWRSNQPSPRRIASWASRGIRSVLSLRGKGHNHPLVLLESEACRVHGLELVRASVGGGSLSSKDRYIALLDAFKRIQKPFVIHCKSGIDRTGFASFLYLVSETDTPLAVARSHLSFKYLHLKRGRHGVLDLLADAIVDAREADGMDVRTWFETKFDPDALTARFAAGERAT